MTTPSARRPRIIAFTGPAGCGKSMAAMLLADYLGVPVLGFADPIREAVRLLFQGRSAVWLEHEKDRVDETVGFSSRHAMQVIGDHVRSLDALAYIRHLSRRLADGAEEYGRGVIIHDLRTDLEADWVARRGGAIIQVTRKGVDYREDHYTECAIVQGLRGYYTLSNPGDLDGLRRSLITLVDAIEGADE